MIAEMEEIIRIFPLDRPAHMGELPVGVGKNQNFHTETLSCGLSGGLSGAPIAIILHIVL